MKFSHLNIYLAAVLVFCLTHAKPKCKRDEISTYENGVLVCSGKPGYVENSKRNSKWLAKCKRDEISTYVNGVLVCSRKPGYVENSKRNTKSKCKHDEISTYVNGVLVCSCKPGYVENSKRNSKCVDIDECADPSTNTCQQNCVNTVGSYSCSCDSGYIISSTNANLCDDIDECADPSTNNCQQNCVNTAGSYSCACNAGYIISSTNPNLCEDIDECADPSTNNCQQNCVNTAGSYSCSCNAGYIISSTNSNMCEDIDECADPSTNNCQQNCVNTAGSYSCSCNAGYIISSTNSNMCEATCGAYPDNAATTHQTSSRKECFDLCINQPLCYRFKYYVGGSCELYVPTGNPDDISIDVTAVNYVECSQVRSQCASFSNSVARLTNDTTRKECYRSCVTDPFCWRYMYNLGGTCTLMRMINPVSVDIEVTSTTFVSCAVL